MSGRGEPAAPSPVRDRYERAALHVGAEARSLPEGTSVANGRDVLVVEVGPRDGLQNEAKLVPTSAKVAFIDALSAAGLPVVEATSFVNPNKVPRLADAAEVMADIRREPGVLYPVLVPNERGLQRALDAGVDAIALFASATEAFSAANIGASIDESFERFGAVALRARQHNLWIRGYVSVAFGCPYSGAVDAAPVVAVAERLLALGCDEICLADTIGIATASAVRDTLQAILPSIPRHRLALHFHDTTGNALLNVEEALKHDVRIFDAAAGGLGGCPFAPGAPGNLATEQLVNRLHGLGLHTGVDPDAVVAAAAALGPYVPRLGLVRV